jgi:hypothetical protein
MTIATASIEATELLRHLEAVEHSAYDRAVDLQIAEGLKQARDPNVKKFSIADVEASTAAIIASYQPDLGSSPKVQM